MSDMVSVPAEKIAALREATGWWNGSHHIEMEELCGLHAAARAVVDAVETEAPTLTPEQLQAVANVEQKAPRKRVEGLPEFTPAPARDDAEKAIAGLLAELRAAITEVYRRHDSNAPLNHVNHVEWVEAVASVIAAHMAAPDELTALRSDLEFLQRHGDTWRADARAEIERHKQVAKELQAERDALRERIRALADESKRWVDGDGNHCGYIISTDDLDAALGDA